MIIIWSLIDSTDLMHFGAYRFYTFGAFKNQNMCAYVDIESSIKPRRDIYVTLTT